MLRVRCTYPPKTEVNGSRRYVVGEDGFLDPDPTGSDLERFRQGARYTLVEGGEPEPSPRMSSSSGSKDGEIKAMMEAEGIGANPADETPEPEEQAEEQADALTADQALEGILAHHHLRRIKAAKLLDPDLSGYDGKSTSEKADSCLTLFAQAQPDDFMAVIEQLDK